MAVVERVLEFLINAYRTSNYAVFVAIALGILIPFVVFRVWRYLTSKGKNPFLVDSRRPPEPLILDQAERDRIIKQGFTAKKILEELLRAKDENEWMDFEDWKSQDGHSTDGEDQTGEDTCK